MSEVTCFMLVGNCSSASSSNVVMLNDTHFISAANDGLYTYNIISNKWKLFMKYPQNFSTSNHTICYNKNSKVLYLYGAQRNMVNINLKTKHLTIIKSNCKQIGIGSFTLNINGECHIIGGFHSNQHLIWNYKTKQFDIIHTFSHWNHGIYGHRIVKARNVLYLFGGYDFDGRNDNIWQCEVRNNYKWTMLQNVKLSFSFYFQAAILTPDERFILLFESVACIYMLDLYEVKLYNAKMRGVHADDAISCSDAMDELLSSGYIKKNLEEYSMILPQDLIGLIQTFFNTKYLYLIQKGNKNYKVKLRDILHLINQRKTVSM